MSGGLAKKHNILSNPEQSGSPVSQSDVLAKRVGLVDWSFFGGSHGQQLDQTL
jgi:hypothetical protein